jgi:primosomal protein N' (replication factor Y)
MAMLELWEDDTGSGLEDRTFFAEIILPFSLPKTFTYRVPVKWNSLLEKGQRVIVPFGKKKFYTGLVYEVHESPPPDYEAKYIHSILDEIPLLDKNHLKLWTWVAAYYMANLGDVMTAALPAALKLASETQVMLHPEAATDNQELSGQEKKIIAALAGAGQLSIREVQEISGLKNVFSLIKALYYKQLIYTSEEIAQRYKPLMKAFVKLHPDFQEPEQLNDLFKSLEKKAVKQSDALLKYISSAGNTYEWVDKLLLQKENNISAAAINALINKNILVSEERRTDRLDQYANDAEELKLHPFQQEAAGKIRSLWKEKEVVLLYGITGSGKSFIYFELIKEALEKGGQVLYLLPEIALTVQLVGKLRKLFGKKVYITHSRFSDNERVEVYQKIASGESCVVIGARSAVFLPFRQLELIVIDEEHDASFKQQDPSPRYQGRDTAILLGNIFRAKILLGSATPSIESYYNAKSGKYGLVELPERFDGALLPEITLLDLGDLGKKKRMTGSFSSPLLEEIEKTAKNGKQSIVFQNRKGYVPIITCKSCGWSAKCVSCDITLTYYKAQDHLRCNYCGYSQKPEKSCPACGSHHLEMNGFGTERIEEELELMLPSLRIGRFDQQSTRGKNAHLRLVQDFEDHRLDVLVGTQMLSKGLDFKNVQLVGVINADQLLNFPDFRSYERTFQLLTQVTGRSGRRKEKGTAFIQTYKPLHPVLQHVVNYNYSKFYEEELGDRERYHYPPYSRLIEITFRCKEPEQLEEHALLFARSLKQSLGERVLGPQTPYISRLKNYYLRRILVKLEKNGPSPAKVKQSILVNLETFHKDSRTKNVFVSFDVDPG